MSLANDSAFPIVIPDRGERLGLTKRELFAAMAMQGMLAYGDESSHFSGERLPELAVQYAERLLAELDKKP